MRLLGNAYALLWREAGRAGEDHHNFSECIYSSSFTGLWKGNFWASATQILETLDESKYFHNRLKSITLKKDGTNPGEQQDREYFMQLAQTRKYERN